MHKNIFLILLLSSCSDPSGSAQFSSSLSSSQSPASNGSSDQGPSAPPKTAEGLPRVNPVTLNSEQSSMPTFDEEKISPPNQLNGALLVCVMDSVSNFKADVHCRVEDQNHKPIDISLAADSVDFKFDNPGKSQVSIVRPASNPDFNVTFRFTSETGIANDPQASTYLAVLNSAFGGAGPITLKRSPGAFPLQTPTPVCAPPPVVLTLVSNKLVPIPEGCTHVGIQVWGGGGGGGLQQDGSGTPGDGGGGGYAESNFTIDANSTIFVTAGAGAKCSETLISGNGGVASQAKVNDVLVGAGGGGGGSYSNAQANGNNGGAGCGLPGEKNSSGIAGGKGGICVGTTTVAGLGRIPGNAAQGAGYGGLHQNSTRCSGEADGSPGMVLLTFYQ